MKDDMWRSNLIFHARHGSNEEIMDALKIIFTRAKSIFFQFSPLSHISLTYSFGDQRNIIITSNNSILDRNWIQNCIFLLQSLAIISLAKIYPDAILCERSTTTDMRPSSSRAEIILQASRSQVRYDDEDEDEGPQPDPMFEQGGPLPVRLHNEFPPELASTPLEDIDSFYHNQRVLSIDALISLTFLGKGEKWVFAKRKLLE